MSLFETCFSELNRIKEMYHKEIDFHIKEQIKMQKDIDTLDEQNQKLVEALERIAKDGDCTAPEEMKWRAAAALKEIGVSDET